MESVSIVAHMSGGLAGPIALGCILLAFLLAMGRIDALALSFAISITVMPLLLVLALYEGWPPMDVPVVTLLVFAIVAQGSHAILALRR
ncbi:hypothetical protein GRZ55_19365 [Chelativorans sp. ZYF759]|uniref:hypothetical protein n=1 Tax=Chelativorans sp. ZYF759 TaxID=2692213 RepID=UPI00145D2B28|nr:hypothetical protein [Chelativorans sp. ZYF759]NMG41408.1 hypothetical protein [Chelativorans sp. ZYF759]